MIVVRYAFCLISYQLYFFQLKKTNCELKNRIYRNLTQFYKSLISCIVRYIRYKCKAHSISGHSFCLNEASTYTLCSLLHILNPCNIFSCAAVTKNNIYLCLSINVNSYINSA